MRIAIVDDIASEREILKGRVAVQAARLFLDAAVSCYASGADFLDAAGKGHFDLVFLDIYMGNENGVDTAEALHYLVKPYTDADLAALFNEVIKRLPADDRYIEVNAAGGTVRLRFQDILYAEHYQHQIYVYSADGERYVTRRTFRKFTAALADGRFFLCSRGVLVSMEHAEDFDGTDFILKGGKRVPVSRDLAKTARTAFGDYLFNDFKSFGRRD